MKKQKDESLQTIIEDVTNILNEIRNTKFKRLEITNLNSQQQRVVDDVEKDLVVCITKLGLVLHSTEL